MALYNLQCDHDDEEKNPTNKCEPGNELFRASFFLYGKKVQIAASCKCCGQSVGLAALKQYKNYDQACNDHQ